MKATFDADLQYPEDAQYIATMIMLITDETRWVNLGHVGEMLERLIEKILAAEIEWKDKDTRRMVFRSLDLLRADIEGEEIVA